jgi:hypothetical protein
MKNLLPISVCLLFTFNVFAQDTVNTIEVRQSLGTSFHQNGKKLRPKQILEIVKHNPDAYKEMKIAKGDYGLSNVLSIAAGLFIGYPIGVYLSGGDANWALAGIGAGLAIVSIPATAGYTKHAKNAVTIYNTGLGKTSLRKTEVKLALAQNRVGLKLIF